MNQVVVIGSGLAGLASATVLAARGYQVTVLEKNEWTGGKAAVLQEQGFRFDMGPTILTIPSVLKRIFAEAGIDIEQRLNLVRLDPQWRCFFDDNSRLDLVENPEQMAEHLRQFSKHQGDVQGYHDFLTVSEALNAISQRYFFWRPVGGLMDILDPQSWFTVKGWKDFMRIRPGKTVFNTVRSHIKDERVAQMLDHFVQYVGSSPEESPAVLCGIAHMQTDEGVWYPMGGTRAVPVALRKLSEELGVQFRTGARVKSIALNGDAVRGVVLEDGEEIACNAVVSNMDAVRTFRELLPPSNFVDKFEKARKYTPACSGVVLYLGLKKRYPQLLHHDFVFSRSPEEEFDYIYKKGIPAPDPSLYLAAPAITEPEVAPEGGEALYVLAHTPYLRPGQDWSKMFPEYRKVILDKLKRTCDMPDLEENIVFEAHLTPQDIHDRYAVLNGAIYGLASHGNMGAFKPSNKTSIKGLYLAGGAAHPGPGMPMVLMSGWIAADAVHQDGVVAPERKTASV
ncbi:MAG: phytoene desaturase [Candidatus Eremiobacteraeota bacterium]|nr:phytoene desaturase [Candidatus Eremiobacteraeota bacterium]